MAVSITGCSSGSGDNDNSIHGLLPVADAGEDQKVFETQAVQLNGSNSRDSDGAIRAYRWRQISGAIVTLSGVDEATPDFISPSVSADELLTFELTVTDETGLVSNDEVNVLVIDNNLPIANAGSDIQALESQIVSLDGTQSQDSDGSITTYLWTQISGTSVVNDPNFDVDSPTPFFTAPDSNETLSFLLTVTDNLGAKTTDQVNVYIASVQFEDDFSQGFNEITWNKVDDSAGIGNISSWTVVNGALQQENYVSSPSQGIAFDQSYHKGTYQYLNAPLMADYRFQVEITPLTNGYGADGNDIGIMFRYQNQNNYYRLSMSTRYGFTRLEKKVNGQFTSLAANSIGYFDNVPTEFLVYAKDNLIQVFIDNEPIFSVNDSDLSFGTIALYCQDKARFDDVLITDVDMAPRVVVSTPLAYTVDTTNNLSLDVEAQVANLSDGSWVEFLLNDSSIQLDMEEPFEAQFNGLIPGEYEVTAILKDAEGNELYRDNNQTVGVGGGFYITAGDSITNGSRDSYARDNISNDGRTVGTQGYAANLNDRLTEKLSLPQIAFNEGLPGATTSSALSAIDSILDRHTKAEDVLLLLGTNDAGQSVSAAEYGNNMQSIVNSIGAEGMTAWVAYVPPQFHADTQQPNTTVNNRIAQYNSEIDNLNNIQEGPNLYTFFINNEGLFADSLHPNSLGHASIAKLWQNSITGATDSPFILYQLQTPALYQQNLLEQGDAFYVDEVDTLEYVPLSIASGIWIMTANGDAFNTSGSFITFDLDRFATVYIAYDARVGTTLPSWVSGSFSNTGMQVESTAGVFNLFSRNYNAGTVVLGGNHAGGGTGQLNYLVIVQD